MASRSASLKKRSDSILARAPEESYIRRSVVGDRRCPLPLLSGAALLFVQAPGLRRSRGPGLLARNLLPQRLLDQLYEALHGRIPVRRLAAMALGGDLQHAILGDARRQPLPQPGPLLLREDGRGPDVEAERHPRLQLVDVLSPGPAAARGREGDLLVWDGKVWGDLDHGRVYDSALLLPYSSMWRNNHDQALAARHQRDPEAPRD